MEALQGARSANAGEIVVSGRIAPGSFSMRTETEAAAWALGTHPFRDEAVDEADLPLARWCVERAVRDALPVDSDLRVECGPSNNPRPSLKLGEVTVGVWVLRGGEVGHVSLTRVRP